MADNSRTPFAHWLSTAMKGRRISDTKLGAHVGVSATAIIRWRNGDAVPRDVAMIDSLADLFEEERAHVRRLAGRGELKDDAGGLESKWAELAFMAQAIENRLKMGLMREYFYDLMKRKFHEGVSEMEATTGLVLGLAEITDLAEALAKAFDEKE